MTTVGDFLDSSVDTGGLSGLSQQIIAETNLLVPNILISFESLNNIEFGNGEPGHKINPFLQFAAKESLRKVISANSGKPRLVINSAYRTVAQQHFLYQLFLNGNGNGANPPGTSSHEDGLALDVGNPDDWVDAFEARGWERPFGNEPWHFSFTGGGTNDELGTIGIEGFQSLWNKNNSDKILVDGHFGEQTTACMNRSPITGFNSGRFLRLTVPPMEGNDVMQVKQALSNAKFLTQSDVNRIFDTKTKNAVEAFQKAKGLLVDGVVGSGTRRVLGIKS
jgi:hypothetical protein